MVGNATMASFNSPKPFIDFPALGTSLAEVRNMYGEESESEPDDQKPAASCFVFHQNGYEISAIFFVDALERILFVPNSEEGFSTAQLTQMAEFYGQSKKWHKIVDNDYMEMFRRDDDAAYFVYNGIAQFKTPRYDQLPDVDDEDDE
jgi:hypothetical protein